MLEGVEGDIPLEGDVIPLEDCEESNKPMTTATLVGNIIYGKTLNRGAMRNIIRKS